MDRIKCQMMADKLHELTCHSNHTDQCDWHYHTWNDKHPGYARTRLYNAAVDISHETEVPYLQVMDLLDTIKKGIDNNR